MAEIKRYQKSQVFNQPVGVVRSTGAEAAAKAWGGLAAQGQRMFEMSYREAEAQQKALGENFATFAAIGKDDDDNYEAIEVPATYSPVAAKAAEAGIQERYIKRFASDVTDLGKAAYAGFKHNGDLQGFQAQWETITNGQLKAISQDDKLRKYVPIMQQMLDSTGKEHMTALFAIQKKLEYDRDYTTSNTILDQSIASLEATITSNQMIEMPDDEEGFGSVVVPKGRILFNDIEEAIERQAQMYPDKMGADSVITTKNKLYSALHRGQANQLVNNLRSIIPRETNAYATDNKLARILQSAMPAFETGNIDAIRDPQAKEIWQRVGLSQEFFNQPHYNKVKGEVATLVSGLVGDAEKEFADLKIANRIGKVNYALANNIPIDAKESAFYLKEEMGIATSQDLINQLAANINKPNSPMTRIMLGPKDGQLGSGILPDVVTNTFNEEFMSNYLQMNPENASQLLSAFQQMTYAQNGQYRISRGFSDKTLMMWNEIEAFQNSNRSMTLPEFMERRKEFALNPTLTDDYVKSELIKESSRYDKMSADNAVNEKLKELVNGDRERMLFFGPIAKRLIWAHGRDGFERIVKQTSQRLFRESKLMHTNYSKTRFSPEAHFTSFEVNVLKEQITRRLRTAENASGLVLGQNVGLVPDRRGSEPVDGIRTALPTYTLRYMGNHPKSGQPVMDANGPIEIGPQRIITDRAAAMGITEKEYAEIYSKAFDRQRTIERNQDAISETLQLHLVKPDLM